MKYSEIREQAQEKRTELFKAVGLFFAFSTEQFNESKTPLREGEKYVSIGAGGYLPKGNVDKFIEGMSSIRKWENSEIKKQKDAKIEHIKYELSNHECYYTRDITNALAVLPYPKKDVLKVFYQELKKFEG